MEKAFCYSVKNALEKTALKEGFDEMNKQYREELYTNRGHRLLLRCQARFNRINFRDSFNRWKHWSRDQVQNNQWDVEGELNKEVEKFEAFVV